MGTLVETAEAAAQSVLSRYLANMKMVVNRVRDQDGRADADKGAQRRQDLARFMKMDLADRK